MTGKSLDVCAVKHARSLVQPVGRRCADGAGAAHDHVLDGAGRLAKVARCDDLELVRQQPLFDKQHRVFAGLECNGAVTPRAPANRDVHEDKLPALHPVATAEFSVF